MRTKIIAGNLIAVLVVGLLSYAMVKSNLEATLVGELDGRIASDYSLLDRSFRLSASELAAMIDAQAEERAMSDVFVSALDENSKRTRAYEAAERTSAWLANPARRGAAPVIVAVIDDAGRVVARNADRNRMYQADIAREVPAVQAALRGASATGIWPKQDENKVLQIAASPIRSEGRVLGALLVGYDVSNDLAHAEAGLLSRDVAFVLADRVYSSSLEQGAESEELRAYLSGPGAAATQAALQQRSVSAPFSVSIGGHDRIGILGPATSGADTTPLAMVVLADRTAQAARASSTNLILILTALGALIVLVYGFLVGTSLLRPIEQLEEGVLAVINGRTDTRIDIQSQELGGLAYRINQLLNVFTGTPEEDESGRVSQGPGARWGQEEGLSGATEVPASSAPPAGNNEVSDDPALAAQLAAEPEDAYYARVYAEYVAAKQAIGEDVSNIPQDKFIARLRGNEQKLVQQHGCRMVRFQVQTRANQVNLKPVVIR